MQEIIFTGKINSSLLIDTIDNSLTLLQVPD